MIKFDIRIWFLFIQNAFQLIFDLKFSSPPFFFRDLIFASCEFCCCLTYSLTFRLGKDDSRKRKGSSPLPTNKSESAKKKSPEEKKVTGFDRGLEPEKILGKFVY